MTHSIDIFVAAAAAVAGGIAMTPRSANDKEYFPQDWFADRISGLGLPFHAQGRNSYPDFWVGNEETTPIEGYEIKSLAFAKGKPARRDYDSNNIDPSGLGRCRLIVPSEWAVSHPGLRPCGHIGRMIAASALRSYTVHLDGQTPVTKQQDRRPDAAQQREFAVFEAG